MSDAQSRKSGEWVLAASLLLVGLFAIVGLVLVKSQADNVSTSAGVDNVSPTISSIFISSSANGGADDYTSGITHAAGTATTIHINGVVEDLNGRDDISSVALAFNRSDLSGGCSSGAADNNDCYTVAACTLGNNANTDQKTYTCEVPLAFYSDSTDGNGPNGTSGTNWLATVTVTDADAATDSSPTATVEVVTTLALTIPSTITYGTLALGATTTAANNFPISLVQQGNDLADVNVSSADAMTCTVRGTIPVASQKYALTDVGYDSSTALSSSSTRVAAQISTDVDDSDGSATNGGDGTRSLWWNIFIPTSGVEGSCSGTNVISAIAG